MATYSNILAWKILWTVEPEGLLSMESSSRTRLKRCSSSNLQSEDQFVSTSLRSSLTIESAVVMATVLLSCT